MSYTSSTIMLVSILTLVSMLGGGAMAQCDGCAPLCCDGFGCVSCYTPTPPRPPTPTPSPPPPSPPPPSPSPPPPSPSPPPPQPQYQCGWQAGGTLCPGGLCCSNWGFCGTTEPFCSPENCQSNCTMPSPSPPTPPPPPTPTPEYQCGTQAGGRLCPGGLCCSNWGFCGDTDAYCSPQNCQSGCPQYDPFVVPNVASSATQKATAA